MLATSDPTLLAVFAEDSAALVGLIIAAAALATHELTGSSVPDAVGSILIGRLLAWVAGGLALIFAIAAVILLMPMLRRAAGERTLFFPRIRYELERDRELIERAVNGRGKGANGGDHATE